MILVCENTKSDAVAEVASADVDRWQVEPARLMARMGHRFARRESFQRAGDLVMGLMSDLPRKNCWTLAERAGHESPDGLQHLLARASWDHDGVRDDIHGYVIEHLGDPDAVLVVDETGDVKKGASTVGVQCQYTGTAGRVENSQVAVHLSYTSTAGHALIDTELYCPNRGPVIGIGSPRLVSRLMWRSPPNLNSPGG